MPNPNWPKTRKEWKTFAEQCDEAYELGTKILEQEKQNRLNEYENSPSQKDWESDEN